MLLPKDFKKKKKKSRPPKNNCTKDRYKIKAHPKEKTNSPIYKVSLASCTSRFPLKAYFVANLPKTPIQNNRM